MAPDSREKGRLVAMWLPRNAPSDFVVDLSRQPAPPEDPKKPAGDYLSFGISTRLFWFLLEAPTILTFQLSSSSNVVLASYPDDPATTINLGDVVKVSWDVVSNPLAFGPLEVEFTWASLTDGLHKYNVPPHAEMNIAPTDLATLGLYAWHGPQFYFYQATAELAIRVNQPSPKPPIPSPPPPPCTWYYFILRPDPPDPLLDPCVAWAICAYDPATAQEAADLHLDGYKGTLVDFNTYVYECQSEHGF